MQSWKYLYILIKKKPGLLDIQCQEGLLATYTKAFNCMGQEYQSMEFTPMKQSKMILSTYPWDLGCSSVCYNKHV